jgi:sugar phosphate isomerase/epimerase
MRIGTTSFIYPGGWLYNVERLAPDFEDLEILFFEANGPGAFPSAEECRGLAACKRTHGLSYSLHTPLEASLASLDPVRRAAGVAAVLRAIDSAAPLEPENYVLHIYLGDGERSPRPSDLDAWRERAALSLRELLAHGIASRKLCVELLDYDFALIEPVIDALDLSIALDIGHLVRDGRDELAELQRYLPRTRIIQWHGTDPSGRDHRSLVFYPRAKAQELLRTLAAHAYAGVLTLEVFDKAELDSSRALLTEWLAELAAAGTAPPHGGQRSPGPETAT